MKTTLIRLLLGWGGICLCIIVAFVGELLVDHQHLGSAMGAILLFVFGIAARAKFRWSIRDFLTSWTAIFLTFCFISILCSSDFVPTTYARRLAAILLLAGILSSYTGALWFSGFAIGSLILRRRERRMAGKVGPVEI